MVSTEAAGEDEAARRRRAKKEAAQDLLARGWSYERTAQHVGGISARTIRRWMKDDPSFRQGVDELRSEVFSTLAGEMAELAADAVMVIRRILLEGKDPHALTAGGLALNWAARLHHDADLETRIAALEQKVDEGARSSAEPDPESNGSGTGDSRSTGDEES